MVSNHAGVQKSDVIVRNVAAPPAILEQSESISVVEGDSIELKVSAVGSQPLATNGVKVELCWRVLRIRLCF